MRLARRLNATYQKVYRNRHVLAKNLVLDDAEYRLWDLLIALYDWDKKHEEDYGTVKATDRGLAELLNWSYSKVCRARNGLLMKGIIFRRDRSVYKIFPLPQLNENISLTQQNVAEMQNEISTEQQDIASLQQKQGYSGNSSIVSYKDKFSIGSHRRVLIKQEPRSESEYQKIKVEGNYTALTVDDMRWIDENIKEEIEISDDQMEKNIVNIFFKGDLEEYKRHLIVE